MRQMAVWLLILSMMIGGCSWGSTTPKTQPGPGTGNPGTGPGAHGIARAEAEALVSAYLQDRVEGRESAALQRLVAGARGQAAAPGELTQYCLLQSTEVEEGWLVQTREYSSVAPEPRSTVTTDFYLVVREGDRLALDRPERRWTAQKAESYHPTTIEAYPDPKNREHGLIMAEDGKRLLARMVPNLPKEFTPYGASPDITFGVGDNGWGALAVAPIGQQVAFVTRGTHAFLGLTDASGQVTGLNLWFEGGAGELAWSHDAQYLAATNMSPRGLFGLQLWSLQQNAPVDVKGLPDGRDISRLQWQGNTLHLRAGAEPWVVNPVTGQAAPAPDVK